MALAHEIAAGVRARFGVRDRPRARARRPRLVTRYPSGRAQGAKDGSARGDAGARDRGSPRPARAAPYEAKFIGQSAYLTLESGEAGTLLLRGPERRHRDVDQRHRPARHDQPARPQSAFANSTWINVRAADAARPGVRQAGRARAASPSSSRAPTVAARPRPFDEYFAPVAEGVGVDGERRQQLAAQRRLSALHGDPGRAAEGGDLLAPGRASARTRR